MAASSSISFVLFFSGTFLLIIAWLVFLHLVAKGSSEWWWPARRVVPIVALTALDGRDLQVHDFDAVLRKPVDVDAFCGAVVEAIRQRRDRNT